MEFTFLVSMSREELKAFFLEIVKEALAEGMDANALNGLAKDPDKEQMVTIKEAAKITGLAVNTIYDNTHQKAIPHYKKGKRIYFRPLELIAWIGKGKVMTREEIDAKAGRIRAGLGLPFVHPYERFGGILCPDCPIPRPNPEIRTRNTDWDDIFFAHALKLCILLPDKGQTPRLKTQGFDFLDKKRH